jgi:hypothetical protein
MVNARVVVTPLFQAHIQEKNSSYTAMSIARQKLLFTFWNVQCVAFNTSEKLNNNLVNLVNA